MQSQTVKLTHEQEEAVNGIVDRALSREPFSTLGGYAGTGKTTVIREIVENLPRYAVCAYTGKAASVLRSKGLNASTIHSLIYNPYEYPVMEPDPDNPKKERHKKDSNGNLVYEVGFALKDKVDVPAHGIIVDEASMVNDDLYKDLQKFNVPLIFVGDHGQLEPVGGNDVGLMKNPMFKLEEVHRNAGEIAHFAEFLRNGGESSQWELEEHCTGEQVDVFRKSELTYRTFEFDQLICAFNNTRVSRNRQAREMMGYNPDHPEIGDRVIILKNDREQCLYNGMQATVTGVVPESKKIWFEADGNQWCVRYCEEQFNLAKRDPQRS